MEEVAIIPLYSAPNTPAPSSQVSILALVILFSFNRLALAFFQEAMAVDDTTATPTQASVREDARAESKSAPTTVSHSPF